MEQRDEYCQLIKTRTQNLAETYQRRIAFIFCQLVEGDLDKLGTEALRLVEHLSLGSAYSMKCKSYQKKLQRNLPKDDSLSFYSPLIWALEEHSNSYPAWYSAGIVGINIVDLNKSTYPDLTSIVEKYLGTL